MVYSETLPDIRLHPFIYCYWELKTKCALTVPFEYRVVADGCIDVFFENDAPQDNFVMGFCKTHTKFALEGTFRYTGIRFLPTMFPLLFGVDAAGLSNRVERLSDVVKGLAGFLADRLDPCLDGGAVKNLLDGFFTDYLARASLRFDGRLYDAVHCILKQAGSVRVESDLDTGISPRQLRRLFAFYVGDSAKTFSKVVRFQHVLHAMPPVARLRQDSVADVGYYDQAHFIKEFKDLYGVTPGQVFGR